MPNTLLLTEEEKALRETLKRLGIHSSQHYAGLDFTAINESRSASYSHFSFINFANNGMEALAQQPEKTHLFRFDAPKDSITKFPTLGSPSWEIENVGNLRLNAFPENLSSFLSAIKAECTKLLYVDFFKSEITQERLGNLIAYVLFVYDQRWRTERLLRNFTQIPAEMLSWLEVDVPTYAFLYKFVYFEQHKDFSLEEAKNSKGALNSLLSEVYYLEEHPVKENTMLLSV